MYPNGANQYRPMVNQQTPQNQQSAFPNGQQLFVPVNNMQPQYRLVAQVLPNGIVQGTSIPGPYQQISSVPVALHQVNQQIRPAPLRVPPEKTNSSQQSNSFRNYGSESFYENKNWLNEELKNSDSTIRPTLQKLIELPWFKNLDNENQRECFRREKSKALMDSATGITQQNFDGNDTGNNINVNDSFIEKSIFDKENQIKLLDSEIKDLLKKIDADEKTFNEWSNQHVNHPNKTLYNSYQNKWSKLKKEMVEKVEKKKSEIEDLEKEIRNHKDKSSRIQSNNLSNTRPEFQFNRNNFTLENNTVSPSKGFNRSNSSSLQQGFNDNRDTYFQQNQNTKVNNQHRPNESNEYWQSKTQNSYVSPHRSFGGEQHDSFNRTNMPPTDNDRRNMHAQSRLNFSFRPKQDGILSLGDGLLPPPRPIFQQNHNFRNQSSFRSPEPNFFTPVNSQYMSQDKDARRNVSGSFQQQPLSNTSQINVQLQSQAQNFQSNNMKMNKPSASFPQPLQPPIIQNNFQNHQKNFLHQKMHGDRKFNVNNNMDKAQFISDQSSFNNLRPSYSNDRNNDSLSRNTNFNSGPRMERDFRDRDSQYLYDEDRRDTHADDQSFRNFSDRIRNISQQRWNDDHNTPAMPDKRPMYSENNKSTFDLNSSNRNEAYVGESNRNVGPRPIGSRSNTKVFSRENEDIDKVYRRSPPNIEFNREHYEGLLEEKRQLRMDLQNVNETRLQLRRELEDHRRQRQDLIAMSKAEVYHKFGDESACRRRIDLISEQERLTDDRLQTQKLKEQRLIRLLEEKKVSIDTIERSMERNEFREKYNRPPGVPFENNEVFVPSDRRRDFSRPRRENASPSLRSNRSSLVPSRRMRSRTPTSRRSRSPRRRRRSRSPFRDRSADRRRRISPRKSPARRSSLRRSPSRRSPRSRSSYKRSSPIRKSPSRSSYSRQYRKSSPERVPARETSSKNVKTDQSSNSTVKTPRSFTEVKQQSAQVKPPAPKRKFQETVEAKVEQKANVQSYIGIKQTGHHIGINDLFDMPGRETRPKNIVIFLRGLPGSGKSFIAKKIRDKELSHNQRPRILCLDDYFMTEVEKTIVDPNTGRSKKDRVMVYQYDKDLESSYRNSMMKNLKKTCTEGLFNIVLFDSINDKIEHFQEGYYYAESQGFVPFVAQLDSDVSTCFSRNEHDWSLEQIARLNNQWEKTPFYMNTVDMRQLVQDSEITDVDMEDVTDDEESNKEKEKKNDEDPVFVKEAMKSKWDNDTSSSNLDKLDGIKKKKTNANSIADFLETTDDYKIRNEKGGKHVRWADIEEVRTQQHMRDMGFVMGQDWNRVMDKTGVHANKALNRTKYI